MERRRHLRLIHVRKSGIEEEPDRCGVGILNTGPHDPMLPACEIHDRRYEEKHTSQSSKDADMEFLNNMLTIAHGRPVWQRPILYIQAYVYYAIVRIYGGLFWNK